MLHVFRTQRGWRGMEMKMRRGFHPEFIILFLMWTLLLSTSMPLVLAGEIVHFYHSDHLGSPLALTDQRGNVVWRRDYKPFGDEVDPGGETTYNTHKYTGREFDPESGLYYYGARYYDPVIGRFTSTDPAGGNPSNPQSWNRYVYRLNNPYTSAPTTFDLGMDCLGLPASGFFRLTTDWDGHEGLDANWKRMAPRRPEDLPENVEEIIDDLLYNQCSDR